MRIRNWIGVIGVLAVGGCTAGLDLPPDTFPPDVTFFSPTNGQTVGGLVGIKVDASDNVSVERVRIFIDGTLRGTFYAQPYYVQWGALNLPNGSSHVLRAEAIDPTGNTGTAEITVTVNNEPG